MARARRRGVLVAGGLLLILGAFWTGFSWGPRDHAPAGPIGLSAGIGEAWAAGQQEGASGASRVVLAFGVASVLTENGMLWVYRPDTGNWLTIDEAFREEGRETHILPLPVRSADIAQMESFGFLLTKSGEMWLYEFTGDRWRKVDPPPLSR